MSRPRRRGRDIHGVLLLDKPQGMSSNDVLQKVKRIYNANRAGHTGALDPLATGMLRFASAKRQNFRSTCWILTNAIVLLPVWGSARIPLTPMVKSCRSVR